jgi:hypothetical protein
MSLKVAKVEISGFRGCALPFVIDFNSGSDSRPCSAIILGDNGTGKSTITDAMEFALQGTFQRTGRLQGATSPSILSLAKPGRAQIAVLLSDRTSVVKEISVDAVGTVIANRKSHKGFSVAPMVLRRKDILTFLNSPEAQRQMVFVDFFRHLRNRPELTGDAAAELLALQDERTRVKVKRREAIGLLAAELSIAKISIPTAETELRSFIKQHVYKGYSGKERKRRIEEGDLYVPARMQELIDEVLRLYEALKEADRKVESIRNELRTPVKQAIEDITVFFTNVAHLLTDWFRRVSNARSFVNAIHLTPGALSLTSLTIELELSNGIRCTPHNLLSEANLDLIALLLFVAIAKEASRNGQEKVLILDDVLQSVDSTIRLQFALFLLEEFADWQVMFTVHDRLWFNQLRDLFRRSGMPVVERHLVGWDFRYGPMCRDSAADSDTRLANALGQGDLEGICSASGLLLEMLCDRLSVGLGVSVTRRREDRYTLGDLWPGVYKQLKKSACADQAAEVDRVMHLRNLVGAHYNEWAQAVALHDALTFGRAVMSLFESTYCRLCGTWLERPSRGDATCRCGARTLAANGA